MDALNISYRTDEGINSVSLNSANGNLAELFNDTTGACRCLAYSSCGSYFAYCNSEVVKVGSVPWNKNKIQSLPHPKTLYIKFSPFGNVIALWEQFYTTAENTAGNPNLNIYSTKTGALLKSIVQKKSEGWQPQWTADEFLCARYVTGEVHFYSKNDFSQQHCKLALANLSSFALTYTSETYHVAVYVPGKKGQPSFVRIFKYPHFKNTDVLANKSFYKAERVDLMWNKRGTALLILTATDVSEGSYYGDQGLHFIGIDGESSIVPLQKKGPIYHIEWHPNSTEFVVTGGYMPAKTTVFNLKCEPVFDFGTGPRNITYFNPFGNILCLTGFGNLKGDVELWDYAKKKLISKFTASDTTVFEWSAGGDYILTATTHPRLRVNNGFFVWHYSGKVVFERAIKTLYDICFEPRLTGDLQPPVLRYDENVNYKAVVEKAQAGRYVPPHLRKQGAPAPSFLRDDYEMPSNQREIDNAPLSKAALKNQKRKEAKQRSGGGATLQPTSQSNTVTAPQADSENDKKIRNLQKKITQIEKLKADAAAGKKLELNQQEKIKTEALLRQELASISLS